MSYASVTAAQRAAVVRAAQRVITSAHQATSDYRTVNPVAKPQLVVDTYVPIDTLLAQLKTAVDVTTAAGAGAVVVNGAKVNAGTVSGTGNFATFTVVNGAITGIVLSAS